MTRNNERNAPSSSATWWRAALTAAALILLAGCPAPDYDLVIANGRVIDPESELDAVRHLGIRAGVIVKVSENELRGVESIDASGLVVAPGFIDLHAHGQDLENDRLQVMDGVTTALELEIGVADVDEFYEQRRGKAINHYGATVSHPRNRMVLMGDPGAFLPTGAAGTREATDPEIEDLRRRIEHGLERGAIGVGFGLQYTPGASRSEVIEMFRVAARYGAPAYVHLRYFGPLEPASGVGGLEEVLAAALITGAPLHVVHINSSGGKAAPQMLEMIAGARGHGLDVTTECYPYTAGATRLESALFDGNWREAFGISYGDLQWAATGERLTEESYFRYRQQGGAVIIFMNSQEVVDQVVQSPLTMIASDGQIENGAGHPRTAGTFSRILGRHVREKRALTLVQALRKMTLMPSQRLEGRVPAMRNKGRIREGADADIVVFDPERIIDHSTYQEPALPSEGMRFVLVAGTPVVRDGGLVPDQLPGQPIRAPLPAAGAAAPDVSGAEAAPDDSR